MVSVDVLELWILDAFAGIRVGIEAPKICTACRFFRYENVSDTKVQSSGRLNSVGLIERRGHLHPQISPGGALGSTDECSLGSNAIGLRRFAWVKQVPACNNRSLAPSDRELK